jgi:RNA polymerase sigma-70 factor (ECF subfamily)
MLRDRSASTMIAEGALVLGGAARRHPLLGKARAGRASLRPRAPKTTPSSSPAGALVYLRSPGFTERALQFREFDAGYVANLRAGDLRTQEHFVAYFTELLHLKLRSRLQSPQGGRSAPP